MEEDGVEILQEPEDQGCCKTVSPRNDKEATSMRPQWYGHLKKIWTMTITIGMETEKRENSQGPTDRLKTIGY